MEKEPQASKQEKKILSHSLFYSFSLYFQMGISLLGGIVIAKFLGPAVYGVRNAFGLALEYESYSDLGTYAAMNRTAPYYRARKEEGKTAQIESSIFWVNFLYALTIGTILILVSFYLKTTGVEGKYVDLVFFLGLVIITTKIRGFYATKLKLDKKFHLLSKIEMICGLAGTVMCVVFVYYWGLRGVFIGLFLADLIYIGYILKEIRYIPSLSISWPLFWEMVKIGVPMMIVFLLLAVLRSADRVLILAMLSEEALGFFGIATVAVGVLAVIPKAIHSVTLAPLMEKFGRTQDIYQIKHYLTEPTVLIAYFLPFLMAVLFLAIHLPIEYFLTQYLPSINVAKILFLGSFFFAAAMPSLSVSFALNKQIHVIFITLPAAILNIVLNYSFIRMGWGIEGVAFGTCIASFIFASVMIWYTFTQFKVPMGEYLRFFLLIYTPFLYTLVLLLTLDRFSLFTPLVFWNDVGVTMIKIGLFFLLYLPVFVFIRKHSAFIKLIDNLPLIHPVRDRLRVLFSKNN